MPFISMRSVLNCTLAPRMGTFLCGVVEEEAHCVGLWSLFEEEVVYLESYGESLESLEERSTIPCQNVRKE